MKLYTEVEEELWLMVLCCVDFVADKAVPGEG